MFQAADFEKIEKISPLFGKIGETLCENSGTVPVTAAICSYVNLNTYIGRHFSNSGWTENELLELDLQINSARYGAKKVFGLYQASNMGRKKWRALSHFVAAIREMGSSVYLDSRIFETSRISLKMLYRKTSI